MFSLDGSSKFTFFFFFFTRAIPNFLNNFWYGFSGLFSPISFPLQALPNDLFSAFDETDVLEGANTGDVKYHLGFSSNIDTPGGEVHVSLNNNPSHLEIVDPVVLGSVRARQDRLDDKERKKVGSINVDS